jgi:site-specific DNA-methyltransferase (adenine-specific)
VLQHGTGALNVDGCRVGTEPSPSVERRKARPLQRESGTWGNDRRSPETYATQRPGEQLGRWPANLIHDGSDEVVGLFPQTVGKIGMIGNTGGNNRIYGKLGRQEDRQPGTTDSGSAARFFYTAKASKNERQGVAHPTVKPIELMAYLCRLVTPVGGTVLDPFMGSGTTIKAALSEGFNAIGIERDPAYFEMAQHRMDGAQMGLSL